MMSSAKSLGATPMTSVGVTSVGVTSVGMTSVGVTSVGVTSVGVTSLSNVTSASTSEVRQTVCSNVPTSTSGVLTVTGSDDTEIPRVTGSEEAGWGRRASAGSDDCSVGRGSLSSISSTDDVKMDTASCENAKTEPNLISPVGSSSEGESETDGLSRNFASRARELAGVEYGGCNEMH